MFLLELYNVTDIETSGKVSACTHKLTVALCLVGDLGPFIYTEPGVQRCCGPGLVLSARRTVGTEVDFIFY